MQSIPASTDAAVFPSVLGVGGNPLSPNAVFLDQDGSIPVGATQFFASLAAVQAWYNPNSVQARLAGFYFGGTNKSKSLPSGLWFQQYNTTSVAAYVRGASVSGMTLAQLQAFSGTIDIEINGEAVVSTAINLASATSFSNAAALITTGLQTPGGIFSGTAAQTASADVLDVTVVASGTLHIGDVITGAGVDAGLTILTQVSGATGGVGAYTVSTMTGFASTAIKVTSAAVCTFDSQRVAFVITSPTTGATSTITAPTDSSLSPDLLLTAALGAVTSQGAAATTPAAAMAQTVANTQNWVTFMTTFDPDAGEEPATIKLEFAAWVNSVSPAGQEAFMYAGWDTSPIPASNGADASSFGAAVKVAGYNGVEVIWDANISGRAGNLAAAFCGATACLNTQATNGRTNYKFLGFPGLIPDVTNITQRANLLANGYNFYSAVATRNNGYEYYQPGSISGDFLWADAFVDQILMNASFQDNIITYLTTVNSVPYNNSGKAAWKQVLKPTIVQYLNFGAIQPGVPLSALQVQELIEQAGLDISGPLFTQGWYLQVLDAPPQTRSARTSPPINFWYTDGGSVNQVQLASIDVQ